MARLLNEEEVIMDRKHGHGDTQKIAYIDKDNKYRSKEIMQQVDAALKEKNYNPVTQLVGYLISGDPTYIPRHNGARNLISRLERDELLEEILSFYLEKIR